MTLFNYTSGNHFKFGYLVSTSAASRGGALHAPRWFGHRESKEELFVARYGRAAKKYDTWRAANIAAAKEILETCFARSLTAVICCSGGLDSEVTLLSFFEAWSDLPFKSRPAIEIATLDFDRDLNQHDTVYVEKFVKQTKPDGLELTIRRFTIDIENFLMSAEFLKLADDNQVISPAVVTQIWLCQEIHRTNAWALPVIGQGEMHLVREASPAETYLPRLWSLVETENLCGLYRHFIAQGLPAIPGFFQYLPAQFESQLRTNPIIHELISNSRIGKLGTRTSKAEIIAFDYPELEARPKYTGFEKIEHLYDERRAFLAARSQGNESKWHLPVFELMNSLRPDDPFGQKNGQKNAEWSFAWGRDGEIRTARSSPHDIFATQWADANVLHSAFRAPAEDPHQFLARLTSYLELEISKSRPIWLAHDGSKTSRIFHCLLNRRFSKHVADQNHPIAQVPMLTAKDVASHMLSTGCCDAETIAWMSYLRSREQETAVLFPLLHGRIVNAEYDRELGSTLAAPRFVWTENESLAVLTNAITISASRSFSSKKFCQVVLPWTNSALAHAMITLTRGTTWFDADEPGPSNWTALDRVFDQCLDILEESEAERGYAIQCESEFTRLKREAESTFAKCLFSTSRFQVSAYNLGCYSTTPFDLAGVFKDISSETIAQTKGLKIISESTWLNEVQRRTPDLKLGANLFFQQRLSGFALLDKKLRVYFALQDDAACAQVIVLENVPNGRLRIRGVNTRSDLERQGHATALLTKLAEHLHSLSKTYLRGFSSIDVYAAPEVVKAFRSAGFIDDVTRVTRTEEVIDPINGKLIASDRELTPLRFSLGES